MYFEIDQLLNSFELGDSNRNRIIIRKLRKYGNSISEYLYNKAITSDDRFISIQLLGAICEINDLKLKKKILNDAEREKDEFILATYISLFKRAGIDEAIILVRDKIQSALDNRVKANCAEFIADFGTVEDIYLLEVFFDYPNTRVSINSILASAKIGERIRLKSIQKLDSIYKSQDRVRANGALYALKKLNVSVSRKVLGFSISDSIVSNF